MSDSRFSRLEIYDSDEAGGSRPFRPRPILSREEREAVRRYLDSVDLYELGDVEAHAAPPVAWDHLRDLIGAFRPSRPRQSGDKIVYRTVERDLGLPGVIGGGMLVCRQHLLEVRVFRFTRARRMLRVRSLGVRERMGLEEMARLTHTENEPVCRMCQTTVAHGNVCYSDDCEVPLHPQWPTVYCSNECAIEDGGR